MNNIVIVGGSGFTGQHLVASLLCINKINLRVLVHRNIPKEFLNKDNITIIKGDLLSLQTLANLCAKNATVINLAYLRNGSLDDNLTGINNLLEACKKAMISRFIHCSTAAVFGRVYSDIITESTICNPVNEYEKNKIKIEQYILEKSGRTFKTVILRPTAIFGPGGKNLLKLTNDLKSKHKILNYIKSCLFSKRKMNLVSVYNVVAAIELFIRADKVINGGVFIISDDESEFNNFSYVEKYLLKSLGLPTYPFPNIPVPDFVLKMLLKMAGRTNYNPRCVYSCLKLLEFGLRKTVSFEEGLAGFVDWYKNYCLTEKVS
jgi:nucleoside-diphosphate-sugar epimerase